MKSTTIVTCLLAVATSASEILLSRDLATVTTVITTVDTNIKALTLAIQGFTSDPTQLNSASQSLLSSIRQGTASISASTELSLADAISLQQTVASLQADGEALVAGLAAKKTAFEQAGLCTVVFNTATELGAASKALIDAVISKVPEAARGVAQNLVSGVVTTLQKSTENFAPGSCTNAAGSGSGSDSGSHAGSQLGAGPSSCTSSNRGVVIVSTGPAPRPTATVVFTQSTFGGVPFPQQSPPPLGGQGQCLCPCQCTATTVPTVQIATRTSSVFVPPASTPRSQNVTASTPPRPVVTAGATRAGSGLGVGILIAAVAAFL